MEKRENRAHEFALYCAHLPQRLEVGTVFHIKDEALVHRLKDVLRLQVGELVVFFDKEKHVHATIERYEKRQVSIRLQSSTKNHYLRPEIQWFVPFLDRDAFEEVLVDLCVMGAASITPISTEKSRRKMVIDAERVFRVMVAAAEQSKQFVLPHWCEPLSLQSLAERIKADKKMVFLCHPEGTSALKVVNQLKANPVESLCCIVGPEGDLVDEERKLLYAAGVTSIALTPTVLRSEKAVTVLMGLLRSCL